MRKHLDLARLLVLRDRLPWFWFAFTVICAAALGD